MGATWTLRGMGIVDDVLPLVPMEWYSLEVEVLQSSV